MRTKQSTFRLAFACLIAAALLPACGGSSTSSGPTGSAGSGSSGSGSAGVSGSYTEGYNDATAAILGEILNDLRALQMSLAGSGAPVQTSRGILGRSFALLAPRQRETLAQSLLAFIARIETARTAAAADGSSVEDGRMAQDAAVDALRALQLVVAADAAGVEDDAVAALNRIEEVDAEAPDAREQINELLDDALEAAQAQVAALEQQLATAQAGSETSAATVIRLNRELTAARASLNALAARFGSSPALPAARNASTRYHARRTGVQMVFDTSSSTTVDDDRTTGSPGSSGRRDERVFNPIGPWGEATEYDVTNRGTAVTDGFNLTPDPVLYSPGVRRVFTTTNQNTSHFPGRGTVYRGELRHLLDGDTNANNNDNRRDWLYGVSHRLVEQGVEVEACSGANMASDGTTCPTSGLTSGKQGSGGTPSADTNAGRWNNWDAPASMTFQYKPSGGFTMGFGGEGVIFSDLERYAAKGGKNCGTGSDEYCDESTTANVELSFGEPQPDPYGEPDTIHWNVLASSPRLPAAASPDLTQSGNQVADHDFGRYELILSNYAGADRRLAYAAYGLFNFVDHTLTLPRVGRMQLFHYGLDAFADSDGRRPTDLTGNNTIEGTFRGHTAAWIVTSASKTEGASAGEPIQNLFRARGDLEMRACIGAAGTSCTLQHFGDFTNPAAALTANMVAGSITNLEYAFQNRPGYWTTTPAGIQGLVLHDGSPTSPASIALAPAAIGADGTYQGVTVGRFLNGGTRPGTYEGAFYGPAGAGLETAGTWRLNSPAWERNDWDAIIGSFGAVCEGTCRPAASP